MIKINHIIDLTKLKPSFPVLFNEVCAVQLI